MLKARLGNEFGDPASQDYKERQEAFDTYNGLVEKLPEVVAHTISRLALGEAINKDDRLANNIRNAAARVLDITNNGTQIGIAPPAREATWAEVFEDAGHREAAAEYHTFRGEAKQSPDAIAACRRRGLQTLKVVAYTHLESLNQTDISNLNASHQAIAA